MKQQRDREKGDLIGKRQSHIARAWDRREGERERKKGERKRKESKKNWETEREGGSSEYLMESGGVY